jgi:integrase
VTLETIAALWLRSRKPAPVEINEAAQTGTPPTDGLRMQSWISYNGNLRNHIIPALGKTNLTDLRTPECEEVIHSLYDRESGAGYRTAAMAKQVLTQIMDYAVRQGYGPDNPVLPVSNVPNRRKPPVKLKQSTVTAVHKAVRSRQPEPGVGGPRPTGRLAVIVQFLFATGMRIGEGLAVRWDDVQMDGNVILVTVSGTLIERGGHFYRQSYPKSSKSHRTLPLTNDWIQDLLRRRHRSRRPTRTNAVFRPEMGPLSGPAISGQNSGGRQVHPESAKELLPTRFGRLSAARSLTSTAMKPRRNSWVILRQRRLGATTSGDRTLCLTTRRDSKTQLRPKTAESWLRSTRRRPGQAR